MNPRAAINDLLPFQGSPFGQLGYFSKLSYLLSSSLCNSHALLRQLDYFIKLLFVCQALFYFFEPCFKFSVLRQLVYSIKMFFICQELFCFLLHICFKAKESAGGGIRTHAPLRTNGFQDRLVMTTSIPLRVTINT